jgi:hypothetical protein
MSTKKNDTDATIRTNPGDPVNPSDRGLVNKVETQPNQELESEASKVVHNITSGEAKGSEGTPVGPPNSVSMGTNLTPLQLLEQAQKAALSLDSEDAGEKERRKGYTEVSRAEGRNVLKHMLRFVESFKDASGRVDEASLQSFLDTHVGKPHGGAKTPYQRISKHCAGSDTGRPLITKRAYALDVIVKRNIPSDELDARFEEKEEIGPDKLLRSGMQKYVLLYEIENGLTKAPADKYKNTKDDRLIKETIDMIWVLVERKKLPSELIAGAVKQLQAELQDAGLT